MGISYGKIEFYVYFWKSPWIVLLVIIFCNMITNENARSSAGFSWNMFYRYNGIADIKNEHVSVVDQKKDTGGVRSSPRLFL